MKLKYTIKDLIEMLSYRRSADSPGEKEFIKKYLDSIPGMMHDSFGNRYIRIGRSDTCFTCHTDTVHSTYNTQKTNFYKYVRQKNGKLRLVTITPENNPKKDTIKQKVIVRGKWAYKDDGDILGADDTTGIWLCLNMISARVPGLYIFHRKEEHHRLGSEWIAKNNPSLLKGIKKVVSFDRKGYNSVITFQRGERTASEEFATSLAKQLGGKFEPDDTGAFTDSYSYRSLVPECTNISIGYFDAHSSSERQDLSFAYSLAKKLITINWNKLPVKRNPKVKELKYKKYTPQKSYNFDYWGSFTDFAYNKYPDYAPYQVASLARDSYSTPATLRVRRSYYCKTCGQYWSDTISPVRCPFCSSYNITEDTSYTKKTLKPKKKSTKTLKSSKPKKKKLPKKINLFNYINKPSISLVGKPKSKKKKREWSLYYDYY